MSTSGSIKYEIRNIPPTFELLTFESSLSGIPSEMKAISSAAKRDLFNCPLCGDMVFPNFIKDVPSGFTCVHCEKHWVIAREVEKPPAENWARYTPPENWSCDFFYDETQGLKLYVNFTTQEVTVFTQMTDWKNKFKIEYPNVRHFPNPYPSFKSTWNPRRPFGLYWVDGVITFNRFKAPPYWFEDFPEGYVTKPTPTIDSLFKNVFGDDALYIKQLLATMFQTRSRFKVIPSIINPKGGSGKGIFEEHIIKPLFGVRNCASNCSQKMLEGRFNSYIEEKLYIGFQELDSTDNVSKIKDALHTLKQLFDDEVMIEGKYQNARSSRYNACVFLYSNSSLPVLVTTYDRRLEIIEHFAANKLQNVGEFKRNFDHALLLMKQELPDFIYKLKHIKLNSSPGFGYVARDTVAKRDAQERSADKNKDFIDAVIQGDVETVKLIAEENRANETEVSNLHDLLVVHLYGKQKGRLSVKTLRKIIVLARGNNIYFTYDKLKHCLTGRKREYHSGSNLQFWQTYQNK